MAIPTSSTSSTSNQVAQPLQQEDQQPFDETYTTLFCRALYDYEAQDASALSFKTDDIIEVLTQQPSGWWDGLLGEERGWFPSNYVTIISDEEAELAFSQAEFSTTDGQNSEIQANPASDVSHLPQDNQPENEEWLDNQVPYQNGSTRSPQVPAQKLPARNGTQQSDFWMPEVTPDGQVINLFRMQDFDTEVL